MQIKRGNTIVAEVVAFDSSSATDAIMGEDIVTLQFNLPEKVGFSVGDYIEFLSNKYELLASPKEEKNGERDYKYTLTFYNETHRLSRITYLMGTPKIVNTVDMETAPFLADFSVTGDSTIFLNLLLRNIRRFDAEYSLVIHSSYTNNAQTLSFDSESCLSVLGKLANAYNTTYRIVGKVIHFGKGSDSPICTLGYGRRNGLTSLVCQAEDSTSIITKIWPFGSDKNIDRAKYITYLNDKLTAGGYPLLLESPKRLVIAPGTGITKGGIDYVINEDFSITRNVDLYGLNESSVKYEDIYPGFQPLSVSHVVAVDDAKALYDVRCTTLDFNVLDCLIPGVTAEVVFQTGNLAGYSFQFNYKNVDKRFELVPREDVGYMMPKGELIPAVGDTFIISGINFPNDYINVAETELFSRAVDYLLENSVPRVQYSVKVDPLHFIKYAPGVVIRSGDFVHIEDINMTLQVVNVKRSVLKPSQVELTLSNYPTINQFSSLTNEVKIVDTKLSDSSKSIEAAYNRDLRAYKYLKTALEEKTRTEGGLIMSSLMALGYSISGVWTERSGMSGLDADGGDSPFIWSGGTFEEAVEFVKFKKGETFTSYGAIKVVLTMAGQLWAESAELRGKIIAEDGTIGGFEIGDGRIGAENSNYIRGMMLYDEFIRFKEGDQYATIGANVLPTSVGIPALGYFKNTEVSPFGYNWGVIFEVSGGMENHAIILNKGDISGFSLSTKRVSSDIHLNGSNDADTGEVYISCYNTAGMSVWLPYNPSEGRVVYVRQINNAPVTVRGVWSGKGHQIEHGAGIVVDDVIAITQGSLKQFVFDGQYWIHNQLEG